MSDSPSEDFRTDPNISAPFGAIPQNSERFRIVPHNSERRSDHTLSVREVARMFETAGVARTERSITNWCQPNKTGIARLDAFFDPNERKYFITPQSVEMAIQEELSKDRAKGHAVLSPRPDDNAINVPNDSATRTTEDTAQIERLRQEVFDLKIVNQGKDQFIKLLTHEREQFADERKNYVDKLMTFNRRIGQLETRLGIEPPTRGLGVISSDEQVGDMSARA
jgi:hypothetical protein